MSNVFSNKSDEESVLGAKDNHHATDRYSIAESDTHQSGVDDGVGEVKRALKHRHLQMIGIGGGESLRVLSLIRLFTDSVNSNWDWFMAWNWICTHHSRSRWSSHRILAFGCGHDRGDGESGRNGFHVPRLGLLPSFRWPFC